MADSNAPATPQTPECDGNCPGKSKTAQRKIDKGMTCAQLLQKIQQLTDKEKSMGDGMKGLAQRFRDYQGDDATHGPTIVQQQQSLRTYNAAYKNQGCGDPPGNAKELASRPLPQPTSSSSANVAKSVAIAGGAAAGGYLIYRGLRMIPSVVIPPLWPTIPANAVIP